MGGETCSFKRSPHGKVRDSLLFPCDGYSDSQESTCNSNLAGELARNSLESLTGSLRAELISRILGTIWGFRASCAKNSLQNSLKQGI